jgi:hypothetical protein
MPEAPQMVIGERMITVRKLGVMVMAVIVLTLATGTSWASSRPATTTTQTEAHPKVTPTVVTGASGYLWLLGTYPCSTGTCRVLTRTTNGGKTFIRVGTPPVGTYGIEFANRQDGYAYSADLQDGPSSLYWTDDGGKSWRLAFARSQEPVVITDGRAYVLVPENCSAKGLCKSIELASSPVTSDRWTTRRLPVTAVEAENPFGWTAFGSNVWLLLTSGSHFGLLVSHNGGRTFSKLTPGGYIGGLACTLTATSPITLWGFCTTGNGGYAFRSTDGGREFGTTEAPWGISNGVQIHPVSDSEAIFYPLAGVLWLTRDGGRHFTSLLRVPQSEAYDCQVALANARTWLVLGRSGVGPPDRMWRTTNGGRTWQPLRVPSV